MPGSVLWTSSVALCYGGMRPIYDKWPDTPTITSVADTNSAVGNIHFPASTVCSNNKVVKKKLTGAIKKSP